MRWRAPAQVAQMGPCPHARPCVGWRVCVRQNVPLEKILPHPMQTLRRNRCQTRTRPRKKACVYGVRVSGATIFAYVGGDPINLTDPTGLDPWWNGPWPNPEDRWVRESREETMRRICEYGKNNYGLVPRDGFEHDLNQRNAEHYFFGNQLGRMMGPAAPVAVAVWEAGKHVRRVTGPETTRPTALGFEMGNLGAMDGWVYGRSLPKECTCAR